MEKNDYYASHKKEYAFIVDGSDSIAICKDRAGNMHIYVNPYENLSGPAPRSLSQLTRASCPFASLGTVVRATIFSPLRKASSKAVLRAPIPRENAKPSVLERGLRISQAATLRW
jgi:hypothetical protein